MKLEDMARRRNRMLELVLKADTKEEIDAVHNVILAIGILTDVMNSWEVRWEDL